MDDILKLGIQEFLESLLSNLKSKYKKFSEYKMAKIKKSLYLNQIQYPGYF